MSIVRKFFYIFLSVTLMGLILLPLNVIVFPQFHWLVTGLAIVTVLLGVARGYKCSRGVLKQVAYCALLPVALIGCILIVDFVFNLINLREGHVEYISPKGETTVVIEYDLASRPFLYRKHGSVFMTKIPFEFGSGYNETVKHEVVWLSENKIKLTDYHGNEWVINLEKNNAQ